MEKALVVGLDTYPGRNYSIYGGSDATAFAQYLLQEKGKRFNQSNTRLLLNSRATSDAIQERLKWLKDLKSNDFYVLYFSGGGSIFPSRDHNGKVSEEARTVLAPYDISFEDGYSHIFLDYLLSPVEFQANGLIILDCLFEPYGSYVNERALQSIDVNSMLDSMRAKIVPPPIDVLFRHSYKDRTINLKLSPPASKIIFYPGGDTPKLHCVSLTVDRSGSPFTHALLEALKETKKHSYLSLYKDLTDQLAKSGVDTFTPRMLAGSNFDYSKEFLSK